MQAHSYREEETSPGRGSLIQARLLASTVSSCPSSSSRLILPRTLLWAHNCLPLSFLVDCGADDSFINESLAREFRLPVQALTAPRTILDLNGKPITRVSHRTSPLTLIISGNHRKQICLYLIPSAATPAVLASPWLARHNSRLDWMKGSMTGWSGVCHLRCLHSALSPSPHVASPPPAPPDLSGVQFLQMFYT